MDERTPSVADNGGGAPHVRPASAAALRSDPARLDALRATRLLDTDAEPAFDRLTRLAVAVLRVPAAFLSLVDEHRDFYKAATGLPQPLAATRELAGPTFCHHAIAGAGPLVIPDTAADPAYRDVPTVRSLGIAAYVGVPLVVAGQTIGSFCAVDTAPRAWTQGEVEVLSELAESALREIAVRQANARLEAQARELDHANRQLQDQAAELEMQTEELQAAAEELAGRAAAAEAARAQLHTAFAQAPAAVAVTTGPEHRFALANAGYARLVGREVQPGQTFAEALPEVAGQGYAALLDRVFATGEAHAAHAARALVNRGGPAPEEGWYDFVYQPLTDASGRVTGVMQLGVDVTAQMRARQAIEALNAELRAANAALAESEARFRAVEDASPDAVLLLRPVREGLAAGGAIADFEFVYANRAAARMLGGGRRDPFLGRRLLTVFPRSAADGQFAAYVRTFETGIRYTREDRSAHGGPAMSVRVSAVRAGDLVHLRHEDIGERVQAEAERARLLAESEAARGEAEAARRVAERANRVKAEFLATMSHELRTPLNAIGGYAELMEMGIRGPVTEQQRQDLGRIQRSQRHLLGLVNEVLNYAKLETGTVRYDVADVLLGAALTEAEGLVAPQARARGLALAPAECPAGLTVRADAEKLRQVLVNLLSNAVKFTDPGGQIAVACVADAECVRIAVRDTGIGIHGDKHAELFEPFVQVRADLTRTAEGTGLGLAISRDLARGMAGDITVESAPGEGSVFTLTLPAAG